MSRCYRVSLKESISRVLSASDEMSHQVDVTDGILSPEDMNHEIRNALRDEGWTEDEKGDFVLSEDGETLTWDLEKSIVTASIEEEDAFKKDVVVTGSGNNDKGAHKNARDQLKKEQTRMDIESEDAQKRMRQKITKKLEGNEPERKKRLNRVMRKTYSEALKKKASMLGQVMSAEEEKNGDEYSLTITVEA